MPDTAMPDVTRLKFGVGQSVPRQEDPILLQGRGRYTDDITLPGQLWAVMVRSPYAHGTITAIETAAAQGSARRARRLSPAPTWPRAAMARCAASCR